jgi:hypothetical protein
MASTLDDMILEQCGGWCGSFVTEDLIYKYRREKFLPPQRLVKHWLAPEGDASRILGMAKPSSSSPTSLAALACR